MSRKSRRRRSVPTSAAPAPVEVASSPSLVPSSLFFGMSGYSGANFSDDRAQIHWPTLDTRIELDSLSREEIMRRVRWLTANEGFIRGLYRNAAMLVGWQSPQVKSGDEAWDAIAEEYLRVRFEEPEIFDHAGKYDFADAQIALKRCRYKDGDSLTVLTEWQNGAPKFAFYEAHQIKTPQDHPPNQVWRNGVRIGPGGRHLAYGVWDADRDKVVVIPARNAIYNGVFDSPGHERAIPPLAHAVNHAMDITEVWANYKAAIKASSLFGAIRELEGNAIPRSRLGVTGPGRTETTADGDKLEVAQVWKAGQIPRLAQGEKMKILHDDRPSPNVRALVEDLIRDISIGFGLPPEVVWEMASLNGPSVRFVLDLADRWIREEQRYDRRWAKKVVRYTLAKGIKTGAIPPPPETNDQGQPVRWWKCTFIPQRSITIDRGKESRSRLDELDAGVGTWEGWSVFDGTDWQDRVRQRVKEVKFAMAECATADLPYDVVFRSRPGTNPVGGEIDTTPPPADP